jgi:PKD repeat protein
MGRTLSLRIGAALAALALLAGCTTHKQEAPSLTGPSAMGTSLVVTVTPDVLNQDGSSQSLVQIQAYDNNGQPLRNKSLRVEVAVDGFITDFGKLSARSVVTDNNGRATATYTAPAAVLGITSTVNVNILVTPAESDFSNATTRSVTIHVVPTGTIGPPTSPFVPSFTAPSPTVGNAATFTATVTGTSDSAAVATYIWDFGDGDTAVGQTVQHTYGEPGSYVVSVGIVDTLGRTNTFSRGVTVGQGTVPTASFLISPGSPNIGQDVQFNASGSTAEAGHRVVDYSWTFGDGASGSGAITTHSYAQAGTYTVTLKVTDDVGRKSSLVSQSVNVGGTGGSAAFTFAPSQPAVSQTVTFDASTSRPTPGQTITNYAWVFDDGATGSGVTPTHAYGAAGTYTVRLTITDSSGQTASTTKTVTVIGGGPTSSFTFAPSQPVPNQQVTFDASPSTAGPARSITSYSWNFDDGSTATGRLVSHAFTSSRTFIVRLTVTDDLGQTASSTQNVTVSAAAPTADFTFVPTSPDVNQSVNFDAFLSRAGAGRTLVNYAWNFGDGTTGSGIQVSHAYTAASTYTVLLTVTDDVGQTQTKSKAVTVGGAGTATFFYSPDSPGTTTTVFTFDAAQSRPGGGATINHYEWTFEGVLDQAANTCQSAGAVFTGTTPTITHQFPTTGTRCVTLTVVESSGQRITAFRPITIQ